MINSTDILNGRILIVDDQEANLRLLEGMLRVAGYSSVESTTDPTKVCELHRDNPYDIILLDIQMPVMDGFQVMEGLKESDKEGDLPVIVITALPEHKLRALRAGAKDFISIPFDMAELIARVHNILEVRLLSKQLHNYNDTLEQRVLERTASLLERTASLKESYQKTIFKMTRAAEYRDEDTGFHVQRIGYYSRELGRKLGQDEAFVDRIFFASPMHDIGKIGIPDAILLKPSGLTPEELKVMKRHCLIGAKILGKSKSPYLIMAAESPPNHHERWDGGGYPNGKRHEAIPLAARIMNICDIYDALRSKRPYKSAIDHVKTVDIIAHGDGRTQPEHFDPVILEAFKQNHQSFCEIFEEHSA